MSSIFGSFSTGIRNFKDALAKGTSDFSDFGTALGSKLKQAATVVGLGNTLNDVENDQSRRRPLRLIYICMTMLKQC